VIGEGGPDLAAAAVDGGHHDVAGQIVAQLYDQLRQVRLIRRDARRLQRLVEPDLARGHRLDLDHLSYLAARNQADHDAIGLRRIPGPVHHPAGRLHFLLEHLQQFVEMFEG